MWKETSENVSLKEKFQLLDDSLDIEGSVIIDRSGPTCRSMSCARNNKVCIHLTLAKPSSHSFLLSNDFVPPAHICINPQGPDIESSDSIAMRLRM